MRNLIISVDTYSWVKNLSGVIMRSPSKFIVMVLLKDIRPIYQYPILCEDAVYTQRRYDLFQIGKKLGVSKIVNLNYGDLTENTQKLVIQLQLQLMMGGIQTVYYQKNEVLDCIFPRIKKLIPNLSVCVYDTEKTKSCEQIILTEEEIIEKENIYNLFVGAADITASICIADSEYWHKVI